MDLTVLATCMHIGLVLVVSARVLLRPYRQPSSRVAWMVVIVALPFAGIVAYILFGEVNIGRRRIARMREVVRDLETAAAGAGLNSQIYVAAGPEQSQHLFRVGHSISGLNPVAGNTGELMADSNSTIDTMVADIDAAEHHVHLLFYIWLPDRNGCKIVDALTRAAARGVSTRAMADGLGSRLLIKSAHWQSMAAAGVKVAVALPIGNPLLRPFAGRIDLRNHRKIVVIDNRISYCGSQNCADPEFLVKARYAPWVDAVIRFEGPIARQNQYLFACDWMSHVDEDLGAILQQSPAVITGGFIAQVTGTGPTVRFSANNDSRIVGAASRSYYTALLDAGVRVFEYAGGLLHAKSLIVDGDTTLIGSANMDRRSFDLNYENNILFIDRRLSGQLYTRQQEYLASCRQVTRADTDHWPLGRRLWNNAVAMLGPVL